MFHSWLNKARAQRHLRVTLREKEEELRLTKLTIAWDKWRERFREERLRVIVSQSEVNTRGPVLTQPLGGTSNGTDAT
jgi:protein SFI1